MSTVTEKTEVIDLPMNEIFADENFNCRGYIAPIDVNDLAQNIREQGLIQPIIVQPYGGPRGEKYRVVAGYRRHMAHRILKKDSISSIVRHDLDDDNARFLNLSENLNRENLNLMQEAKVVKILKDKGYTNDQIKDKLNVSKFWVQTRIYALDMPDYIQEDIQAGVITQENLLALYHIRRDPERQAELVKKIKTAKARGEKLKVKPSAKNLKKDPHTKMVREKGHMDMMQEHIAQAIGYDSVCETQFAIRCLAWARGDISSFELFEDIAEIARFEGKHYTIPTEDLSPL
jgi:ParB family chromosome partitioning protein